MRPCPADRPRLRATRHGFTLVELLAVISILAILLVVAIPGFNNVSRSSGVRSAATALRADLSLARQYAINKSTYTYVVFPTEKVIFNDSMTTGLPYRSYAVFYVDDPDEAIPQMLTEWKELPPGAVFDLRPDEEADAENVLLSSGGQLLMPIGQSTRKRERLWTQPSSSQAAFIFSPRGMVVDPVRNVGAGRWTAETLDESLGIFITEGFLADERAREPDYTSDIGSYLRLYQFTGRSRMGEYDNGS